MKRFAVFFALILVLVLAYMAFGADITTRLSTTDGSTKMAITDSDVNEVGNVDSDGNATFNSLRQTGTTGNLLRNQNTLQTGTTFYVSSGTVAGQITATTLKFADASTTTIGVSLRHDKVGHWGVSNLAASATNSQLVFDVAGVAQIAAGSRIKMAFAGTAIGICVTGSAARTAGTATFQVFKNGVDIGASSDAVINGTNTQFVCSTGGTGTLVAGDILDIRVTTDAGFLPTASTEYTADLYVNYTN